MWTGEKLRSAFVVTFKSFVLHFYFFPRSLAPSALSSFERICWFGIAFPDSYSWITCGFSLIRWASWDWVSFFSPLACMMAFFNSVGTRSWDKFSVSSSSFFVFKEVPLDAALFDPALTKPSNNKNNKSR